MLIVLLTMGCSVGAVTGPEQSPEGGRKGSGRGTTGAGGDSDVQGGIDGTSVEGGRAAGGESGFGGTTSVQMDAAATAGTSGGPVTCPAGNICDDFESATIGTQMPAGWQRSSGPGASVMLDNTRSFSGSKALSMSVANGGKMALAMKKGAPLFPVAGNHLYGRMMVYVESAPTDTTHWTNIQAEGNILNGTTNTTYRAFYRYGGQHGNVMANYDTTGVSSDCFKHSGVQFPSGRWACFQWEFNGPANEMRFWMDSTELTKIHVVQRGQGCVHPYTSPWIAPIFDTLLIGWHQHQDAGPRKMWVDDVAVGPSPTPCPQPDANK